MELEAVLIERHSFITSSKLYARNYVAIHYQTLFLVFYPVTTQLHLASILLVAKNWESLGLNISPKMIDPASHPSRNQTLWREDLRLHQHFLLEQLPGAVPWLGGTVTCLYAMATAFLTSYWLPKGAPLTSPRTLGRWGGHMDSGSALGLTRTECLQEASAWLL